MSEMEENQMCIRCKIKPFVYTCNNCHPFTNFCVACDNFVHTLPSKKSHKRTLVNPDFLNSGKGNSNAHKNIVDNIYNQHYQSEQQNDNNNNYNDSQPRQLPLSNRSSTNNNQNNNQNDNQSNNQNYGSGSDLNNRNLNNKENINVNKNDDYEKKKREKINNFSPISQKSMSNNKVMNTSNTFYKSQNFDNK